VSGDPGSRVVLATTALTRGGVWRHVEELGQELARRGTDVVVALAPEARELRAAAARAGLPAADLTRTARWRGWIWHAHLHDTFDRVLASAILARRAVGPTVVTEHLPRTNASDESLLPGRRHPLARPAKTAFKRVQLACADAVIAVSASSAAFLAERYRIGPGRVDVVANGVHVPDPAPIARETAKPLRVVSVGSVIRQKGHDLLVRAAAGSGGGWEACVLGEGPMREPLARLAAQTGAPVSFGGWSDDVAAALRDADVACLPSRWEACPYAALDAMAAGLPVVATAVDGLRDLVDDGVNGVLVAPEDPGSLAGALDAMARDDAARLRMGRAARERAARLSLGRMAAETAAVYRRVASARRVMPIRRRRGTARPPRTR
jgi:glycosyltransferase involved in cell wall biosynthesis